MPKITLAALTMALIFSYTQAAQAKDAGDWTIRAGASVVAPKSDNGDLTGTLIGIDVKNATSFTFEVSYMFTDNLAVELLAAYPFKHDVHLDGLGKVATVKQLPPTLSFQYHFNPQGKWQPYVGAGLNLTTFFDEDTKGALEGTKLKLKDSWGPAAQFGIDYAFGEHMLVNANIRYIYIQSDAKLDGEKIAKIEISPWVYGINVGYTF